MPMIVEWLRATLTDEEERWLDELWASPEFLKALEAAAEKDERFRRAALAEYGPEGWAPTILQVVPAAVPPPDEVPPAPPAEGE